MSEQNTLAAELDLSPGLIITVIRSVLKSWLLIVAAALIAAMGAFVYTDASYTPEYRTTTTFVATSGGTSTTTYSHLNAASNAASVFSEVINSSLLQQKVRELEAYIQGVQAGLRVNNRISVVNHGGKQ